MSGLRVLAVDDERPALSELAYLLERSPRVAAVTTAGSAAEALAALQDGDVDAVFCDIRMPGMDGLALARVFARFAAPPAVVFVTAYDEHAVEAFDLAVVDYLLKPLRPQRLDDALARIERALGSRTAAPAEAAAQQERIAVELGGTTRYLNRSDIVYVEAQGDYVRLHTRTANHLVRTPLAQLEERWADAGFLRVHRGFLVNVAAVEQLRSTMGSITLDLGQGQSVPVSRRFSPAVRDALVKRHRLDRPADRDGAP
jgi:DNA-binding LytR/AlgR family response regulator